MICKRRHDRYPVHVNSAIQSKDGSGASSGGDQGRSAPSITHARLALTTKVCLEERWATYTRPFIPLMNTSENKDK